MGAAQRRPLERFTIEFPLSCNVLAAVGYLRALGADSVADKIVAKIDRGEVDWNNQLDKDRDNASTSMGGVITLSAAKVGMYLSRTDFSDDPKIQFLFSLALTLSHELIHVEHHSTTANGMAARLCSNQEELQKGRTPHEIDAWTATLRQGLRWFRHKLIESASIEQKLDSFACCQLSLCMLAIDPPLTAT